MLFIKYLNIILLLINSNIVYSHVSPSDFFAKQSFLIQTGFSNIVWTYIESSDFKHQNVSSPCKSSLYHAVESSEQGNDWPFKLFEASGRVPADFTGLGYIDPGNYEQCLNLDWIGPSGLKEASKYCLTSLLPNNEQSAHTKIYTQDKLIDERHALDIQIGFCIPSTCSNDDLTIVLTEALKAYSWDLVAIRNCEVKTHFIERLVQASTLQKICLSILAFLIFTVLYSTYLDRKLKRNESESPRKLAWYKHFSIYSSYRQIVQPNMSSDRMLSLIKFAILLHSIVLILHTLIWPSFIKAFPFIAVSSGVTHYKDTKIPIYVNGEWINEGLFVYGGFARSADLWKNVGPETSFIRLLVNILFKFIALSILMTSTMFVQIVLPLFTSGPSGIIKSSANACEKSFFKVIFAQAHWIDDPYDACVIHYWSVCVECHYLILVVTLIYLYKRHPKAALSLNIISLVAALLLVAVHTYHNQYPFQIGSRGADNFDETLRYVVNVNMTASRHLWIYLLTTLCIYLIMNSHHYIINKVHRLGIISRNLTIFGIFLTINRLLYMLVTNFNNTRLNDAIYSVLHRILIIIFYSFVMFLHGEETKRYCSNKVGKVGIEESNNNDNSNNKGNIEDTSISPGRVKFYHIVSAILRSSYCIHLPILIMFTSSLKNPILTQSELIYHVTMQIVCCLIGGFLFHLFFIGPLTSIFISLKKSKSH
ncbi:uncharacterized protein LOC107366873 [Tetranychus urticae]|uniref:Nose resistant-to-fluoxetine protein N-terminal domain-containing protein n=1 Tax=Tetranychus urticae TaxID=32264 RepID=T1KSA1_TETUR|nr:uncharacterized protein LOC107366873 [Tetranychus urticae]